MKTFISRVAVVEFLVRSGKPRNRAKVAVDEAFNYDGYHGNSITGEFDDEVGICAHNQSDMGEDISYQPVSEEQALTAYDDFCGEGGYFTETSEGFVFDGEDEPKYDLNGDTLPSHQL